MNRPGQFCLICTSLICLAFVSGCGEKSEDEKAKSSGASLSDVKTTPLSKRLFSDKVEALGTVRALEAIDISSNVTDRIEEIFFEDGDSAKKGDLLVRLEDAEETASVESAKAEESEQEREIERLRNLVDEGAVSEVRLEEYRTQREIAAQKVAVAKAKLADRKIIAPCAGVLGFRRVSRGALVMPGDIIATLDVLDPVKLDFTVPETFLSDLKGGLEITAVSDAFPGLDFTGTVTQIDTRVNPVTRSVTVRAEIPNPDRKLRPGMLMTTVLEKNPQNSLSVPERAIVSVQSNHFIFVVGKQENGTSSVSRTQVQIGRRLPGYVEIIKGAEEGATVVTDGLVGLVDGAGVNVTGEFDSPADAFSPIAKPEAAGE